MEAPGVVFDVRLEGYEIWSVLALDDDRLALGCGDGFIRIISISKRRVVKKFLHEAPPTGRGRNIVHHLACDPDGGAGGTILASASQSGVVRVWNKKTLDHEALVLDLEDSVAAVALSSRYVAAASYDTKVRVFARGGRRPYELVHTICAHSDAVVSLLVCPNSDLVFSAGMDGMGYATDVSSGSKVWKANLRMYRDSPEIDPSDLLLLKDGRVAITVLEKKDVSVEPHLESIELRIWSAPKCLPPPRAELALGVEYESGSEEEMSGLEPAPRMTMAAKAPKRARDSDADEVQEAPEEDVELGAARGAQSTAGNSAQREMEGTAAKRPRSSATKDCGGAGVTLALDVAQAAGAFHASDSPDVVAEREISVPPADGPADYSPMARREQVRDAAGGEGSQRGSAKEATSRRAENERHVGVETGDAQVLGNPVVTPEPTSSRPPVESAFSERLLKKWSESGLERQVVQRMKQRELGSALAASLVDCDFERLEEFLVLERVLQASFALSKFATSALRGKFGLEPETFVRRVKQGMEEWEKKQVGDSTVWGDYYDAIIANFVHDHFKS